MQPCDNALTSALVLPATHALIKKAGLYCEPNLLASDEMVADKYGQIWIAAADGSEANSSASSAYPLEVSSQLVRLFAISRVVPGMVWNVTGVVSFSYGSWELTPRSRWDVQAAAVAKNGACRSELSS